MESAKGTFTQALRRHIQASAVQNDVPLDALKTLCFFTITTLLVDFVMRLCRDNLVVLAMYLLCVLVTALFTYSVWFSVMCSIGGMVLSASVFQNQFRMDSTTNLDYMITLLVMVGMVFLTTVLSRMIKDEWEKCERRALDTEALLELSRCLHTCVTPREILLATSEILQVLLERTIILYEIKEGEICAPVNFVADKDKQNADFFPPINFEAVRNSLKHMQPYTEKAGGYGYQAIYSGERPAAVFAVAEDGGQSINERQVALMTAILQDTVRTIELYDTKIARAKVMLDMEHVTLRADMLATVSHDIRTPLTTISGNADILLKNATSLSKEQKRDVIEDIYNDALYLNRLAENILSITYIDNNAQPLLCETELVDDVIQETLKSMNASLCNHTLSYRTENEFMLARMDARLIQQVLRNLIDNAVKHTDEGCHIEVTAKREGAFAVVSVSDNGKGIPDVLKPRLFDAFFSTDRADRPNRRGMGLGLPLCKSIVKVHGGTLVVKDNQPKGTVFTFTLPIEEAHSYASANDSGC